MISEWDKVGIDGNVEDATQPKKWLNPRLLGADQSSGCWYELFACMIRRWNEIGVVDEL